jgi:hypothetical protein
MSTLSDETMKILSDIDEMVMDETEKDAIQYDSIDFILQNLRFANQEIFTDESQILASRRNASKTAVLQMLFYLACTLKPFTVRRRAPMILIFGGEGYIGSQLVLKLCEYGLSSYLNIYSRGMLNANHWIEKGIRMLSSLDEVSEKEGKFDIILYCAGLAAFPSVARMLAATSKVNEATAFITCTLGLQRRRVYNFLSTACVLRTYVEHSDAIKRSFNMLDRTNFMTATKNMKQSMTLTIPLESDFLGSNLSEEAYAADLIARRCNDIRHLIFVIENNYVVRGINATKARNYALHMILGNIDSLHVADQNNFTKPHSESMLVICAVLDTMEEPILRPFREQLSKYIRVIDLPELLEIAVRVDAPEPMTTHNLLLDIHNQQGGSVASGMETVEIALEDLLESDKDDNSIDSASVGRDKDDHEGRHFVDPLDLNSIAGTHKKPKKVPSKLAEKQKEKEEARKGLENLHAEIKKRKQMLEAQRKVQNDDLYNNVHPPMHSEDVITKIFENDLKSETSLIGLPARIQALIGEIDEENRQLGGTAAFDSLDEDCMNEAFEGFIRLPQLSDLAITQMDLSTAHFISTLKNEGGDEHSEFSSMFPSQIAASNDKSLNYLSIESNAAPVLVESLGKKGFVSVLHDRVIEEQVQFRAQGGIEIVHAGIPDDPVVDEKAGESKDVATASNPNNSSVSRQPSNNKAGPTTGGIVPSTTKEGLLPVLSKGNSAKYAMMRTGSNKSLGSDASQLTSPSMSSTSKPSVPADHKPSKAARPTSKK